MIYRKQTFFPEGILLLFVLRNLEETPGSVSSSETPKPVCQRHPFNLFIYRYLILWSYNQELLICHCDYYFFLLCLNFKVKTDQWLQVVLILRNFLPKKTSDFHSSSSWDKRSWSFQRGPKGKKQTKKSRCSLRANKLSQV